MSSLKGKEIVVLSIDTPNESVSIYLFEKEEDAEAFVVKSFSAPSPIDNRSILGELKENYPDEVQEIEETTDNEEKVNLYLEILKSSTEIEYFPYYNIVKHQVH